MLPIKYQIKPTLFSTSIFDELFNDFNLFEYSPFELFEYSPFKLSKELAIENSNDKTSISKRPLSDIIETENNYEVDLYLAGIKKEDVSIKVDENILTIKAERKTTDVKYNRKESFSGLYQKSFALPKNINEDDIKASFVDGILKVSIPKTIELKAKEIEIT